jgi:sortase (surface protein transpeptidase)
LAIFALAVGVVALLGTMGTSDPAKLVLSRSAAMPKVVASTKTLRIARSRPVTLTIPALSIHIAVGTLGLQADDQVMVPTSTHVVGWYDDGPTPGQVGSAVILGHVDSYVGPGTFYYLKDMKAGNSILVTLADGTSEHFIVTDVVQYSKAAFPDQLVYGSHGTRSLQLVTCGGTFDHETGHYESNIVVFSRLVSATSPTH